MSEALVMTERDVRDLVASGRVRGIHDILRHIRDLDFTKVRLLLVAIERTQQATKLEDKVREAMNVLKIGAELTTTTTDDNIVKVVDTLLDTSMLAIVVKVIRMSSPELCNPVDVTLSTADIDRVTAAGIPWSLIMLFTPLVAELIRQLAGEREE
jgi:hypothetical protein